MRHLSAAAAGEKGTPVSRALRAGFAGGAAAFAGGLLYFLVVWLFSLEVGLIAIAVGFAVGIAVKWGSYGRGGAFYQAMAMSLTYLAIVASLMAAGLVQIVSERPAKSPRRLRHRRRRQLPGPCRLLRTEPLSRPVPTRARPSRRYRAS